MATLEDQNVLSVDSNSYGDTNYQTHLLEQYKLAIEMADRISQRRMLANTFFVGIHTTFLTIYAAIFKDIVSYSKLIAIIPILVCAILCLIWIITLKSYRDLNKRKYVTINDMEKHLPLKPYSAEHHQKTLNSVSLTSVEVLVPWIFMVAFFVFAVILLLTPALHTPTK